MYTTVIVRPYLETTVATKNEGMQVVESIKKEINDEVIVENIGLSNIQRQLELIYPTHRLSIENGNIEFIVKLTISLNDGKI